MTSPKALAAKVEKMKENLEDAVEEGLEDGVNDTQMAMRRNITSNRSIASGHLLMSLTTVDGPLDEVKEIASRRVIGADYWPYIEYGTGMGSPYPAASPGPPLEPILRWVREKGVIPREYETQEQVAYAIRESLTSGTISKPFVRPALRGPRGKDHIARTIKQRMNRAIRSSF